VKGALIGPFGRVLVRFELRQLEGYSYLERVLVNGHPVG
jgi:hypothetical protein